MEFVAEKENEFISYYIIKPKKGRGYLVDAFNGQQAIAKVISDLKPNQIVCIKSI